MIRQTSIDVYHQIENEGLLSKRRFQVYEHLFKYGPMTQMETCRSLNDKTTQDRSFMPRFAELKNMGVIRELGTKECDITGRNVILWDVTNKLPRALPKKKKPRRFWLLEFEGGIMGFDKREDAVDHLKYYDGKIIAVKQILMKLKKK